VANRYEWKCAYCGKIEYTDTDRHPDYWSYISRYRYYNRVCKSKDITSIVCEKCFMNDIKTEEECEVLDYEMKEEDGEKG